MNRVSNTGGHAKMSVIFILVYVCLAHVMYSNNGTLAHAHVQYIVITIP